MCAMIRSMVKKIIVRVIVDKNLQLTADRIITRTILFTIPTFTFLSIEKFESEFYHEIIYF